MFGVGKRAPSLSTASVFGASRRFAAPPFSLSLFDEAGEPLKQLAEPIVLALHGEGTESPDSSTRVD